MTSQTTQLAQMLPAHAKVQIALRQTLSTMRVGDKILSERELCDMYEVSRPTVRRAVSELCEAGILETRHRSGTFLMRRVEAENNVFTRRKTRMIGLLVPTIRSTLVARMVEAIEHVTTDRNYRIVLSHDHGDPDMQCRQLDQLHNHTLDGLIIYPDATNITRPSFIDRLNTIIESGTPVVLVDRNIPGVNTLAVVPDSEEGMCQLTRHMLMHGLSRFAVITWGPEAGVSHETRWAGFQRAMVEANLEPEPVLVANVGQSRPNEVVAREVVTDWLEKYKGKRPFDGIICFHDNMAMGAYLALQQAGLRVPEDMALGSFDNLNLQLYEAMGLSLTTVNQPVGLIGDMAARMLIEHLDNRMPLDAQCVKVRCDLIIRTSCGCLHTTI